MEIKIQQFIEKVNQIFGESQINKIVVSNLVDKNFKYKKVVIEYKINRYMINCFTEKQCFTKNIDKDDIVNELCTYVNSYKQFNFFSNLFNYELK